MPTISVIVPVYKVEPYLRQCVDSILTQTFRDFELILVDDGSPDGCPAICDEYAAKDSRVRVIHKANGGLSSARNAGLDIAQGEYVLFVDSDDWVHPECLERLLRAIRENDADMAMCNFVASYPPEHFGWKRGDSSYSSASMIRDEFADFLALPDNWRSHIAWNKLYKAHIWDNIRFPEGYIHEDEAVIHRIAERCKSVRIIEDSLYYYRQDVSTSIMGRGIRIQSMDKLTALADRILCASDNGWRSLRDAAIAEYIYWYFDLFSRFHRTEENEKYFRRMEDSLKIALPYILKAKSVSIRHKFYLSTIRVNPKIYTTLKRLKN